MQDAELGNNLGKRRFRRSCSSIQLSTQMYSVQWKLGAVTRYEQFSVPVMILRLCMHSPFNSHNKPMRIGIRSIRTLLSPFYMRENRDTKRESNLPRSPSLLVVKIVCKPRQCDSRAGILNAVSSP